MALCVAVAVAYTAGSLSSFLLFQASAAGAVFFPPAGVTLAALLLTARRRWVWVLAGAAVAELGIDVAHGIPPAGVAGFVLANVAEPLAGAALVRRRIAGPLDLSRRVHAVTFLAGAVAAGPVAGAVVGATTIVVVEHPGWWAAFGQFWAGDALAVLTLGTALVALGGVRRSELRRCWRRAAVLPAAAGLTVAGFWSSRVPLIYLPVPLLVGIGVRGQAGLVGLAGFAMAFTANVVSAAGRGPWGTVAGVQRLAGASLQLYVACIVLGAGALAVAVGERDRARAESEREAHARRRLQALQRVTARLAGAATVAEVNDVLTGDGPAALNALGVRALQRAELFETEQRAAHQLQRALLPAIMADLPGVAAAARYLPATEGQDVGGDWYDVFALPAGRVGIVVGDVIGHGLTAAVAMGRLQQYVRWIAGKGATPGDILGELDELCPSVPGASYVTVGYAEYDPVAGSLRHARAGHPPPLLVTDGTAEYLWDALSEPLPTAAGPRPQAETLVAPGAMLVWYSDGLVERRTETLDAGLDRLRTAAARITDPRPQRWCDCLLDAMITGNPTGDDSVVACVRLGTAPPSAVSGGRRTTVGVQKFS